MAIACCLLPILAVSLFVCLLTVCYIICLFCRSLKMRLSLSRSNMLVVYLHDTSTPHPSPGPAFRVLSVTCDASTHVAFCPCDQHESIHQLKAALKWSNMLKTSQSADNAFVTQYNSTPGNHGLVKFFYARVLDIVLGTVITAIFSFVLPW